MSICPYLLVLYFNIIFMSVVVKKKVERLSAYFRKLDGIVVAFSGGVDSSVLAKAAYDALGKKALAVTVDSPTFEQTELSAAKALAKKIGIRHLIVQHDELENECFRRNEPDRCYHCKKGILSVLKQVAESEGISSVVEGTNAEELLGHRPGYQAVKEEGVCSPLAELGFKKKDIRAMAAYLKLPNADKPSMACLASRIPYGTEVTRELLEKVSEAEAVVRAVGVGQLRVRVLEELAVVEVSSADFPLILRNRDRIVSGLKKLGFSRVVLDLAGYSTGSMDR
jgi:uncharacterized protein